MTKQPLSSTKETSTKKSKSLTIKELSPELLDRVNSKAAAEGVDQVTFVIEALEDATRDFIEIQKRVRQERIARKQSSSNS